MKRYACSVCILHRCSPVGLTTAFSLEMLVELAESVCECLWYQYHPKRLRAHGKIGRRCCLSGVPWMQLATGGVMRSDLCIPVVNCDSPQNLVPNAVERRRRP